MEIKDHGGYESRDSMKGINLFLLSLSLSLSFSPEQHRWNNVKLIRSGMGREGGREGFEEAEYIWIHY